MFAFYIVFLIKKSPVIPKRNKYYFLNMQYYLLLLQYEFIQYWNLSAFHFMDIKDKNYWKSGSFYYDTGVSETYGISGTISAGKSIFWKRTKIRLTSETASNK